MSENLSEDFESKLAKANEILKQLGDENLSLEQSVKLHKEGKKLLEEADKILQNAKLVVKDADDEWRSRLRLAATHSAHERVEAGLLF